MKVSYPYKYHVKGDTCETTYMRKKKEIKKPNFISKNHEIYLSDMTFDKTIDDVYEKYDDLYKIMLKLRKQKENAYLFGSSVWRCILDCQDGHDFDIVIEWLTIENFKSQILEPLGYTNENIIIKKIKYDDVVDYDNLRGKKILYSYDNYKMTIISTNQQFDLIFVSSIHDFLVNICDFDSSMLTYDIRENIFVIAGRHLDKTKISFDDVIKSCKEKKISCKYAISSDNTIKTSFSRFVKLIKNGFTYDVNDIAEIVCRLLCSDFCLNKDYDSVQKMRFLNENLIDDVSYNFASKCIDHCLKNNNFNKYDYLKSSMKLYLIRIMYILNNESYDTLFDELCAFMSTKYDLSSDDLHNEYSYYIDYIFKKFSQIFTNDQLNIILPLFPDKDICFYMSNRNNGIQHDHNIKIFNIMVSYFSKDCKFINNIIKKCKLSDRKNFVLDVCTYSEDIFDLVKKNIITIDEVTNFFNFLNNNDSTSLTLYAYVYLRRKIWDKCENIFCNFINGKHIFPAPLSHVISSSLDITKLFSSNEYFYINDDVFEYKYFEHFAITFNIHEIKINRTTGSMHASALYNFENFISCYGKKMVKFLIELFKKRFFQEHTFKIYVESSDETSKFYNSSDDYDSNINIGIIIASIFCMNQDKCEKYLKYFLEFYSYNNDRLYKILKHFPNKKEEMVTRIIKELDAKST